MTVLKEINPGNGNNMLKVCLEIEGKFQYCMVKMGLISLKVFCKMV